MKNKNVVKFGIPILLTLSISECGMISASNAEETVVETTQSLEMPEKTLGVLDIIVMSHQFKRLDVEIKEVAPWLNPENKNKKIPDEELIAILKEAGFSGSSLRMAWAIVQEESTARIYAHNRNRSTGDNSYGLFQINMIDGIGPARLKSYELSGNDDLFDPLTNASVAFKISKGGSDWSAWTTYKKAKTTVYDFPG